MGPKSKNRPDKILLKDIKRWQKKEIRNEIHDHEDRNG